ncbi:MAG: glycosyltransferase [Deltaproteobacteria bacterium]|nr:glycosyltransferase [Deltaproteobacteria bacterium]
MLLALGATLLAQVAVWHAWFARAIARSPVPARRPERYPSLSVIRPIRGLDVGAEANVRAALATGYPGEVETLFVFDDDTDDALPVVRRIVDEASPGTAEILFSGAPPPGRTGKLHAMIAGARRAKGELVAFGDSDSRPSPELLTELVDALYAAPDIGATFAPVVVADPPRTAGDVGYAMLMDALYGPTVARAAGRDGRLPFIMGQLVVFRADALAAIGGPACADGQLVDDMYLGRCMSRAGFANVMIRRPLAIANAGTSLREFMAIYRRWLLFGRNGLTLRFTWPLWVRGVAVWLAAALLAVSLATGAGWAALLACAALVAHGASLERLHVRLGGAPLPLRLRWMSVGLFLLAPLVLASTSRRTVAWRGRAYALRPRASLATR